MFSNAKDSTLYKDMESWVLDHQCNRSRRSSLRENCSRLKINRPSVLCQMGLCPVWGESWLEICTVWSLDSRTCRYVIVLREFGQTCESCTSIKAFRVASSSSRDLRKSLFREISQTTKRRGILRFNFSVIRISLNHSHPNFGSSANTACLLSSLNGHLATTPTGH